MTIDPHTVVHPDRRLFLSDLVRWEKDVATWQQELSSAAVELDRAAEAAEDHRKSLESPFKLSGGVLLTPHVAVIEDHSKALEHHRDRLREEQAFLAEYEAATGGPEGAPPDSFADRVARHPRLWDAHERLKRHHHAVMESTARLLRALAEPM